MGLFNILKGQFIEVIEWTDSSANTMVWRFDDGNKEIMMGAQLTVRESQVAVMVNEGRIADVFAPGRYELNTQNMPILTALKSWKFGFNSPFKTEIYFINTRQFLDLKWGTSNPVMMRDAEFGMIRLRAFGIYAFRVSDPVAFLKEVFGTSALLTVEGVEGQVKRTIVSTLSDILAQSGIPALDLAANYEEIGQQALATLSTRFMPLGLKIESFIIENISLPEEVEKMMDKRTSMGVVGDLNKYTQFQTAEAIGDAARNPGMGGMGAGMAAGMAMGNAMQNAMGGFQQAPATAAQPKGAFCTGCGTSLAPGSRFCPGCGQKQSTQSLCSGCGAAVAPDSRFCPGCGQKL